MKEIMKINPSKINEKKYRYSAEDLINQAKKTKILFHHSSDYPLRKFDNELLDKGFVYFIPKREITYYTDHDTERIETESF